MLTNVMNQDERVVVGKENSRDLGTTQPREWFQKNWEATLNQLPSIHILVNGWFMFNFKNAWVMAKVIIIPWCIVSTPFLMKKWSPFFDVIRDRIDELLVWVRMSRFPRECWRVICFEKVGNTLGTY